MNSRREAVDCTRVWPCLLKWAVAVRLEEEGGGHNGKEGPVNRRHPKDTALRLYLLITAQLRGCVH